MQQSLGIIETVAHIKRIDLQHASLNDLLYVYALTFKEIDNMFRGDLVDFPENSLQNIVDAFKTVFNFFNDMQSQLIDESIANDIKFARGFLVKARSFADTAARIIRTVEPESIKFYEISPIYQQNLYYCSIEVVNINNQISAWLQP